jgi:hypothetical protein
MSDLIAASVDAAFRSLPTSLQNVQVPGDVTTPLPLAAPGYGAVDILRGLHSHMHPNVALATLPFRGLEPPPLLTCCIKEVRIPCWLLIVPRSTGCSVVGLLALACKNKQLWLSPTPTQPLYLFLVCILVCRAAQLISTRLAAPRLCSHRTQQMRACRLGQYLPPHRQPSSCPPKMTAPETWQTVVGLCWAEHLV